MPEVTFGSASATQQQAGTTDLELSGTLFQLGCRAGAVDGAPWAIFTNSISAIYYL